MQYSKAREITIKRETKEGQARGKVREEMQREVENEQIQLEETRRANVKAQERSKAHICCATAQVESDCRLP